MILNVIQNLLEDVGLRECSDAEFECTPEFDLAAIELVVIAVMATAMIVVVASATVSILSSTSSKITRALWLTAIWALALLGAAAWFVYSHFGSR